MSRGTSLSRPTRLLWLLLLALACGPALALGLGQIEVKSRHGEPLLAEIPIVSSDPGELEQLQARLASPETFARVGLQPPSGVVSDLRFAVALDPRGRPVIRVTTDTPMQASSLTFLLEVDWGQGRLVREYAALVRAPETVAAVALPPIQAPEPAPSDTIVRAPEAAPADAGEVASAPAPASEETAARELAASTAAEDPAADAAPTPAPVQPQPAPVPVARPSAGPDASATTVQAGQTLSGIAAGLRAQSGRSLNQTMVALLQANPDAFIRGNLNLLREGAVLRVPGAAEWDAVDAREASALVREHVAQWRQARQPVPQPVESADAAGATAAAPRRTGDARLAIVPPSGGADEAGTRSGISAGGEGDMLRQQELSQAQETIAARNAEVDELKARVAELEQLQQQQAQLIALKDGELAAAQQRLADSNAQTATVPVPGTPEQASSQLPWLWIGVGLLVLALLAWLIVRRRPSARESSRSFLAAAPAAQPGRDDPDMAADAVVPPDAAAQAVDPAAAIVASGWAAAPAQESPAAPDATPPWHADVGGFDRVASVAPLNPAPAGQERIELARAYLDLGDVETARTLLQEVADSGDAASRGEAARLLRELV